MATKPSYPPVTLQVNEEKPKKTISISCTHTWNESTFLAVEDKYNLTVDCPELDTFTEELRNSGIFKEVYSLESYTQYNLVGPKKPVPKTDFYLEIYTRADSQFWIIPWALLHAYSIGFIPVRVPINFEYQVSLYEPGTKIRDQQVLKNNSAVWYWTPLVLVNGFRFFDPEQVLPKQPYRNAIRHYLKELQSKGLI